MFENKNYPVRKLIRLPNFDYSGEGYYSFTINTYRYRHILGEIIVRADPCVCPLDTPQMKIMQCNQLGKMIWKYWRKLPKKFPSIAIDQFIAMPNHIHGIIQIRNQNSWQYDGQTHGSARTEKASLSSVLQWFKTMTTNEFFHFKDQGPEKDEFQKLWHRNYYDHVIRSQRDLDRIRAYIRNNPMNWL